MVVNFKTGLTSIPFGRLVSISWNHFQALNIGEDHVMRLGLVVRTRVESWKEAIEISRQNEIEVKPVISLTSNRKINI